MGSNDDGGPRDTFFMGYYNIESGRRFKFMII